MLEKLGEIDTTAIEELVEIKAEQELLESRLEAMEEKKGDVTDEVFDRVRADYEARLADLDEQARPLKDQARREYARLRDLHQQCEDGLRAARLDTEELRFRHDLGEFEDEEFEKQLEASEKSEEERSTELAEAERLTERFVEAFRSREELEEPIEEPEPPAEPLDEEADEEGSESDLAEAAPAETDSDHTAAVPVQTFGDEAPDPNAPPSVDNPEAEADVPSSPPPPVPSDAAPGQLPPANGWEDTTVSRGGARLQLQAEDGSVEEFTLGITPTTIGRSPDCVVHVESDSASRQHAEVYLDGRGYVVRDLGSNNGTFVNELKVTEAKLNEGDVVRIGLCKLVFREG